MMRAGTLNSYVTVEYRSGAQDAAGQPVDDWIELAGMWANIKNRTGAESIRADQQSSTVRTSIRVRWREDITADMRVVHGSRIYEIKAVLPAEDERDRVDLVCEIYRG
jgi:SPP1 family predicted phage head-tail adaptor